MIFDVRISEQADRDLRAIYEYIAFELLAPENAAGQLDRLEEAISKLDHMPEKYRKYDREPEDWRCWFPISEFLERKRRELKSLFCDNY